MAAKTFRVRQIPHYVQFHEVARLLHRVTGSHGTTDQIHVFSLASSIDSFDLPPSKVSTVMFDQAPSALTPDRDEWVFGRDETGLPQNIIIDTHFLGLTTFNEVDQDHPILE